MKKIFVSLSLCSMALFASMGSSIKVPTAEHLKYTFGNHKKHPVQKLEKERFLRSLAPLSKADIQKSLENQGYGIKAIELKDIVSELVYEVYVKSSSEDSIKLYVDPANAAILKKEVVR